MINQSYSQSAADALSLLIVPYFRLVICQIQLKRLQRINFTFVGNEKIPLWKEKFKEEDGAR